MIVNPSLPHWSRYTNIQYTNLYHLIYLWVCVMCEGVFTYVYMSALVWFQRPIPCFIQNHFWHFQKMILYIYMGRVEEVYRCFFLYLQSYSSIYKHMCVCIVFHSNAKIYIYIYILQGCVNIPTALFCYKWNFELKFLLDNIQSIWLIFTIKLLTGCTLVKGTPKV